RGVAIERQELVQLLPHPGVLARVEGRDRDVGRQTIEHFPGVRRRREALLRRQVEAPRMTMRDQHDAGENARDQYDLRGEQDGLASHATPRQLRAPSARSARNRKNVMKATKKTTSGVSITPCAKP